MARRGGCGRGGAARRGHARRLHLCPCPQEKEHRKLLALQEKERQKEDKLRAKEERRRCATARGPLHAWVDGSPLHRPARSREKELQRALQQQEKANLRLRQREAAVAGPRDDLDLEWDALMVAWCSSAGSARCTCTTDTMPLCASLAVLAYRAGCQLTANFLGRGPHHQQACPPCRSGLPSPRHTFTRPQPFQSSWATR